LSLFKFTLSVAKLDKNSATNCSLPKVGNAKMQYIVLTIKLIFNPKDWVWPVNKSSKKYYEKN